MPAPRFRVLDILVLRRQKHLDDCEFPLLARLQQGTDDRVEALSFRLHLRFWAGWLWFTFVESLEASRDDVLEASNGGGTTTPRERAT